MQWNWLKVFYYVAKYKNFTRAAEKLNISQSAVSYTMNQLEHSLQTSLFKRLARGIHLTQEGALLFEYVKSMQHESNNIKNNIFSGMKGQQREIQGKIRIATTSGIAGMWLPNMLSEFLTQYPGINIEILSSDESLDVETMESDISIRPKVEKTSGIIQKPLVTFQLKLFASPQYIQEWGELDDLNQHRLIAYGGESYRPYGGANWLLYEGLAAGQPPRKPFLSVNSSEGAFRLAEKGHGIISFADNIPGQKNAALKNIFPKIFGPKIEICCIYSEKMQHWAPVVNLVNYLIKYCKEG